MEPNTGGQKSYGAKVLQMSGGGANVRGGGSLAGKCPAAKNPRTPLITSPSGKVCVASCRLF